MHRPSPACTLRPFNPGSYFLREAGTLEEEEDDWYVRGASPQSEEAQLRNGHFFLLALVLHPSALVFSLHLLPSSQPPHPHTHITMPSLCWSLPFCTEVCPTRNPFGNMPLANGHPWERNVAVKAEDPGEHAEVREGWA